VASAQVPETGRWQDLDFTAEEVQSRTAKQYHDILAGLAKRGILDDDREILERVRSVAWTVVHAAIAAKPEAATWGWEVHVTSDPEQEASCMAGGKLLLGSKFIARLGLEDGELAALIGHEVAHAVAEHNREELTAVRHINPAHRAHSLDTVMAQLDADYSLQIRLARLLRIQESEADQLGMALAYRAGWSMASIVRFFAKLEAAEPAGANSWSHPTAAIRLHAAKSLAQVLEK
jgi:predicted Zn-dependent protease